MGSTRRADTWVPREWVFPGGARVAGAEDLWGVREAFLTGGLGVGIKMLLLAEMGKLVVSLVVALLINGLVAVGAAVAALDAAPSSAPTNLVLASRALKPADLVAVRTALSDQAAMSPMASRSEQASIGALQTTVTVEGVQPNYAQLAAWQVDQGRFFTSQDETSLDPVAVVSDDLSPAASVGGIVRLQDVPFTIVGVGRATGAQHQQLVLVPLRTGQIRLFGASAVDAVFLQVGSQNEVSGVTGQLEGLLRTRHNLRPGQPDDFSISDVQSPDARDAITGTSVLRVIEQFVCSAKDSCARLGVS